MRSSRMSTLRCGLACALVLASACTRSPRQDDGAARGGTPQPTETPPPNETAQQRIERLEREARALARADGCASGGSCRAATGDGTR